MREQRPEFLWNPYDPPQSQHVLAHFVKPEDPFVRRVQRAGERVLAALHGDGEFYGLDPRGHKGGQVESPDVAVEALFWSLRFSVRPLLAGIPHYLGLDTPQFIRLPSEIRSERKAICIDLACLLAGVVLRCLHFPLVAVLERETSPGCPDHEYSTYHAVLGYWRIWKKREAVFKEATLPEHAVLLRDKLEELCSPTYGEAAIGLAETLWTTKRPPAQVARRRGRENLRGFQIHYATYFDKQARARRFPDGTPCQHRVRYAVDVERAGRLLNLKDFNAPRQLVNLEQAADFLAERCRAPELARRVRTCGRLPETRTVMNLVLQTLEAVQRAKGGTMRQGAWRDSLNFLRRAASFPAVLERRLSEALTAPPDAELQGNLISVLCDMVYWWGTH